MGSADDIALKGDSSLHVDGRVGFDGTVPLEQLMALVTGIDEGRPSIALLDVLAEIRLSAHADVLVLRGVRDRSVALPVRAVVRHPDIRLVLDASDRRACTVLLHAPEWADGDDAFVVRRMTALSFPEFVMDG